jgi:outer membrane protein insertion porin family
VRSYFHPAPDGHFDDAARDAALKALIATGCSKRFPSNAPASGLWCICPKRPCSTASHSKATRRSRTTDLAAAVEAKPRGSLQRATVQADVGRIIEVYRRAGRSEVRVDPQIIDRGNGRVDLVYTITEGAKTPVRQIDFTGNKAFGKRQLSAVIKTSATHMLSFLTGGNVYDADRVAQDQEQLRLYYRSKGYADVSVPSAKAEYDPATKGFTLNFAIDEGPLYRFREVSVACNVPGLDCDKLRALPTPTRMRCSTATHWTRPPSFWPSKWQSSAIPLPRRPLASRAMPPRNVSTSPS